MGRLLKLDGSDALSQLRDYCPMVDTLLKTADKQLLAEVARVLALHVAYYERRYGPIPMQQTTAMYGSQTLTEEEGEQLAEAMKCLIIVIGRAANEGKDRLAVH
jgi:hypothetical protein